MFDEAQVQLIGILAASSGFYVGAMFLSVGQLFKDKMLKYIGISMILIAATRGFISGLGFHFSPEWWSFLILTTRAIAVYLLIIGSLNGDIRYKETKYWLAGALALSLVIGIRDEETFIFSYILATAAGWVFAADRFWSKCGFWSIKNMALVDKDCQGLWCKPYCMLGVLFLGRALITLVGGIWHENLDVVTLAFISGILVNLAMIPYIFRIGFCRHRVAMDCERTLEPVSQH